MLGDSPSLRGGVPHPPLDEHLQRIGLELAGVLEDGLDTVGAGGHDGSLLQVRHPFHQNRRDRAFSGLMDLDTSEA